jgi:DNA polymerase elongation subunit (family B)
MLILDIETWVKGDRGQPDPLKDIFRFIGAYEYETGEYHFLTYKDEDKIKELLQRHRVIITFNGDFYDIPILQRHGLWSSLHLSIDTRVILKKRGMFVGAKDISLSLNNVAKHFNLEQHKMEDFDYSILNKDDWSEEELVRIKEYTLQDIKVTKQLYDYLAKFFEPFKEFLSPRDNHNFSWLRSSMAVYSYKVFCKEAGLPEEYDSEAGHEDYEGGFVLMPTKSEEHDDVYVLDFNSLYPHNNIQANLFSWHCNCCNEAEKWRGNEMFPIKGAYCSKHQGKIEEVIQRFYKLRREWKQKKDKREYVLKIVLNVLYGITGNSAFKSMYHKETAADCTLIGRQCLKTAVEHFEKAGYEVLYGDTDSVFIKDPFKDKERLLRVKDELIVKLKANLPFPSDTFDMGIDAEIKHLWFFKLGNAYKKKHYLFVTKQGEIVIKGLPMIKGDSSGIALAVFNRCMAEQVKGGNIKFKYGAIRENAYKMIDEDLLLVARRIIVKPFDWYAKGSQLQAMIAKKYGSGNHLLIPNRYLGVGQTVKYCTVDEFRERGYTAHAVVLNKMWSELEPFLDYIPEDVNIGRKNNPQLELLQWTNIG